MNLRVKMLGCAAILLVTSGAAFSQQTVTIQGTVTDPATGATGTFTTTVTLTPPANKPPDQLQNGQEWPATFTPYGATSIWNMPLPDNPVLYAQSAAIVAQACGGGACGGQVIRSQETGPYDNMHAVYFAAATDPLVSTRCTLYCGSPTPVPAQIRIPPKARPSGGTDSHMAIVQPDGTEIDLWATTKPSGDWQTGQTVTFQGGATCGNFYTGSGYATGAASAGGACLAGGVIREAELKAGKINHALSTFANCVSSNVYVFPATQYALKCSGGASNVPLGARIQLDLTDAQIDALSGVSAWQRTLLHALHQYGAYVMDTTGDGGTAQTSDLLSYILVQEGGQSFVSFGQAVPLDALYRSWGWSTSAISGTSALRYFSPDNWAVDMAAHLRVVHPCYAQGVCK